MRSKKALALLVAASMVFTMNTAAFAGVEAKTDDSVEAMSQSAQSKIDKSKDEEGSIDAGDLATDKDTVLVTKDAKITFTKELSKQIPAGATIYFDAKTTAGEKKADVIKKYEKIGFVPKTDSVQMLSLDLWIDGIEFDADDYDGETLKVDVGITDAAVKALGKGNAFAYCVDTDYYNDDEKSVYLPEYAGTNGTDAAVMGMELEHCSEYAFTSQIDTPKGWISANFVTNGVVLKKDSSDQFRTTNGSLVSKTSEFADDDDKDKDGNTIPVILTADASNGYKITAPSAKANGYRFVKWVNDAALKVSDNDTPADTDDDYGFIDDTGVTKPITADAYSTMQFDEVKSPRNPISSAYETYVPVFAKLDNIVETPWTVSGADANGHKVQIWYNTTPAYTGKKLKAGDAGVTVEVDGKDVTDLAKFKTKGKKKVGSEVTIILKSIQGLDKETNKLLKNKVIGTVKIRQIEASEVVLFNKNSYGRVEGQITVSLKKGAAKKVNVIVPKNFKFNKNNGGADWKAKKLKVNKKTYDYDSATNILTFKDNAIVHGKLKVKIASK